MYQILLAEDEETLRNILKLFFEKNGFEIDVVDNGDDALAYADYKQYDIIILDIMMPGKTAGRFADIFVESMTCRLFSLLHLARRMIS